MTGVILGDGRVRELCSGRVFSVAADGYGERLAGLILAGKPVDGTPVSFTLDVRGTAATKVTPAGGVEPTRAEVLLAADRTKWQARKLALKAKRKNYLHPRG